MADTSVPLRSHVCEIWSQRYKEDRMHMNRIRDLLAERGVDVSGIKTADEAVAKLRETLGDKDSQIAQLSERRTTLRIVPNGKESKQAGSELPLQCQTALSGLKQFCYDLQFRDPDTPENVERIDRETKAIMKRDHTRYDAAIIQLITEKPSLFRELELAKSPREIFSDLVAAYAEKYKGSIDNRIERLSEDNDPNEALELALEEYVEDYSGAENFITLMHPSLAQLAEICEGDWGGFINACRGAWDPSLDGEAFAEHIVTRYNRARSSAEKEQEKLYQVYLDEMGGK